MSRETRRETLTAKLAQSYLAEQMQVAYLEAILDAVEGVERLLEPKPVLRQYTKAERAAIDRQMSLEGVQVEAE